MPAGVLTALWAAGYVVACLLGRIVVIQPGGIGLVWPAAGVALVWLASVPYRRWRVDAVVLALATAAVIATTGGDAVQAALSTIATLQAAITVVLLRRWVPGFWGTGGRAPFDRLRHYGLLVVACAVGVSVQVLLRTLLGVALVPEEDAGFAIGRFGRQLAAMVTVGALGLLLGGVLTRRRDQGLPPVRTPGVGDVLHGAGIATGTSLILGVGFLQNPENPSTFMLTVMVVWAAVRFSTLTTAAYAVATGALATVLTIDGYGPIAQVENPETRALLAQILVVVLMVIGMSIALTRQEQVAALERLRRSEESLAVRADELDALLTNLDEGVAIIEEDGRMVHANPAVASLLAGPTDPLVRDEFIRPAETYHLYHPDGRPLGEDDLPYKRALRGELVEEELHLRTPSVPAGRVLKVSARELRVAPGAKRRAYVTLRDVTSEHERRLALTSFAGTVAHDLNNPLSVIDGWAEALEEDLTESSSDEPAMAVPMVRHIRDSVEHMRALVRDLLAHAVARDQSLKCEVVPLTNLVKHIAASRDTPTDGGAVVAGHLVDVWADKVLLRQVLDNLIGNAFKYVAPGTRPRVVVECEPDTQGWTRVLVRDNGIGIPADQRDKVFERFHRLTGEEYQGTGLGLAICERIVQRHGGRIWVTGNPDGVGSCFVFTLPTTPEAFAATMA